MRAASRSLGTRRIASACAGSVPVNLAAWKKCHGGPGSHILVLRLDSGLPIRRLTKYEFSVDRNIKLHQHAVLYAGVNPF